MWRLLVKQIVEELAFETSWMIASSASVDKGQPCGTWACHELTKTWAIYSAHTRTHTRQLCLQQLAVVLTLQTRMIFKDTLDTSEWTWLDFIHSCIVLFASFLSKSRFFYMQKKLFAEFCTECTTELIEKYLDQDINPIIFLYGNFKPLKLPQY